MASAGDTYTPEIWSRESLLFLVENLEMANLVKRDFEDEVANFGDTVNTRKRNVMTARSWTGHGESQAQMSETMTVEIPSSVNVAITLDTMKYTAFLLEDKDKAMAIPEFQTDFIEPATYPLAEAVDSDIITEFLTGTDVDGGTVSGGGDDSTDDGAALNVDDILKAKRTLDEAKCPKQPRRIVFHTEHEYDLLKCDEIQKVNEVGTDSVRKDAILRRLFGFDLYASQNIGSYTSYATIGDIPQSLAFHPDVLALITRPLPTVPTGYGGVTDVASYAGVSLRASFAWETLYKGIVVSFDVLYGVQLLENALGYVIRP